MLYVSPLACAAEHGMPDPPDLPVPIHRIHVRLTQLSSVWAHV